MCINIVKRIFFQHNQPIITKNGSGNSFLGETLKLHNISRTDAGEYICRAENGVGHGAARESVILDILCEYFILPLMQSVNIKCLQIHQW